MTDQTGPAASAYSSLESKRQPFLDRARRCSEVTLPFLIPKEDVGSVSVLPTPWQSHGSRGVNNLASKLILTLLPPSAPFFRLVPSQKVVDQLQKDDLTKIEEGLGRIERRVLLEIEKMGLRAHLHEATRHLLVGGNVLLNIRPNGCRVFPLSQFVCRRDPEGNLLEIVTKEMVSPSVLPASVRESVKAKCKENEKSVCLYTHVCFDDVQNRWEVYQEVQNERIPEAAGHHPKDKLPWIPLRWSRIDGEDYGRGHCEEYLGDLLQCEQLSKAIGEYSAACARLLFLVDPGGMTSRKDVEDAVNGAIISGRQDDVKPLTIEKFADFQVTQAVLANVEKRLEFAFLLNTSVQRQAERVTAEEIRYMASELEDALGGVYSLMSVELQMPLVNLVLTALERKGEIKPIPKNTVDPTIVTGLDALGRTHELMRLDSLIGGALQNFGPQILTYFNMSDYLRRRATGLGIEEKGLIKDEAEVAQDQAQANRMALAQKAVAPAINAVSAATQQANQQSQASAPAA